MCISYTPVCTLSSASLHLLFSLAYVASKMLGLIRQVLFNALFGTGPQATAYYAAFRLPDTLFNLIAGGALISAFLPIFVSYETQRGEREARRLASLVFNVLLVSLTACVLLAELVAPALVWVPESMLTIAWRSWRYSSM